MMMKIDDDDGGASLTIVGTREAEQKPAAAAVCGSSVLRLISHVVFSYYYGILAIESSGWDWRLI